VTTSSHTWLRIVIAIFRNHNMNVDMPAQCVEGVVTAYQMETQMNQTFTVRLCSVLYEPRPYPPQQGGGLAAFEIHDVRLNVANISPFSR